MDRAHLFLVHFPIALLLTSVLFEVIGHLRRREDMQKAGYYMLLAGCVGAVLAAITGLGARRSLLDMLTRRPGGAELLNAHTVAGLAITVLFVALLLWRSRGRRPLQGPALLVYVLLALVGSAGLVATGYSGGAMAHPQRGSLPAGPVSGASAPVAATVRAEGVWARPSRPMTPEGMGAGMANQSGMTNGSGMSGMSGQSGPMAGHGGGHGDAATGATSAIYLTVVNEGAHPATLVGARTDVAAVAELHETRVENDVMQMQPVSGIPVPAGGRVDLKPGGFHIMLMGVQKELKPGDRFPATLVFAQAGPVPIEVTVRES